MNKIKRVICCTLLTLLAGAINAQSSARETLDVMRSNGKIYVVVAVVITILLGVFIYLFSLDQKISKLEKNLKINSRA